MEDRQINLFFCCHSCSIIGWVSSSPSKETRLPCELAGFWGARQCAVPPDVPIVAVERVLADADAHGFPRGYVAAQGHVVDFAA